VKLALKSLPVAPELSSASRSMTGASIVSVVVARLPSTTPSLATKVMVRAVESGVAATLS